MSHAKTAKPDRQRKPSPKRRPVPAEPVTVPDMANYICREVRSLMVQAKNTRRRLEKLFWFAAQVSVACDKLARRTEVSRESEL